MKLYVCFSKSGPKNHPCKKAAEALNEAGYTPEIEKVGGIGFLPKLFRNTKGRREVEKLTGNHRVPTLVLDDGTVVDSTKSIIEWAKNNPAKS